MSKILMNNVKITATNGGKIHNYDSIEINDSILQFTENSIDFTIDESVSVIDKLTQVPDVNIDDLKEIIAVLKNTEPDKQEAILRKSFLHKFITGVKDIKPFVDILFKWFEINP